MDEYRSELKNQDMFSMAKTKGWWLRAEVVGQGTTGMWRVDVRDEQRSIDPRLKKPKSFFYG